MESNFYSLCSLNLCGNGNVYQCVVLKWFVLANRDILYSMKSYGDEPILREAWKTGSEHGLRTPSICLRKKCTPIPAR